MARTALVTVPLALGLMPNTVGSQSSNLPPTFSQWTTFCEGVEHTTAVALGDLDRDGDLDVIFGNGRHLRETDWIYSNDGRGVFYGKRPLHSDPDATYGIALGDLNGDGSLDAVVANDLGSPSRIYRNDGKGNFTFTTALGSYPAYASHQRRAVALGDLDGDGDLDAVLVGLGTDHIYLNEERGSRWTERALGSREPGDAPRATGVAVGDVDGDRDLDIVIPGRYEARSAVYMNDGKAGFAEARVFGSSADDTTSVALGDIDRDGDLDIVAANWEQPHAIHLNDGRGQFLKGTAFGDGRERTWSVSLADLDLDGDIDVVLGNANIGYWRTDLDADGRPDRFGNERRDIPSRIYLNDGSGRLTGGSTFGFGLDDTRPIALGDVDGDGDADIVMGNDCQPNHVFFNPIRGPKAITLP